MENNKEEMNNCENLNNEEKDNINGFFQNDIFIVELTFDKLNYNKYYSFAKHEEVGAISSFIGTTKRFFQNQEVIKLEYECHPTMTIKQMKKLCEKMVNKYGLIKVCLCHRLGIVPITEESLIIITSSVSRKESLKACEEILEEVKKELTVWKKEYYKNSDNVKNDNFIWKENDTCLHYLK